MPLHRIIARSVEEAASRTAVTDIRDDSGMDYARLERLSDRLRDRLAAMGVGRGDRVGIYLRKSADGVAAIFGILKAGACYVPVDPTAPASRNAYIHNDCRARVVILERRFEDAYWKELERLGGDRPRMIVLNSVGNGTGLEDVLGILERRSPVARTETVDSDPDDLAYILYTSGSTGAPKGVMLSHRNALAFLGWCSETFKPRPTDVFSSHAPFHFDLSILDLFLPLKHSASVALIPEEMTKEPKALSRLIGEYRITVWYSAPSTLSLMSQFGDLPKYDLSSLRLVLFAGEVFPVVHLRSFKSQVPKPVYFNLYGPTETNVCTYFEIPPVVPDDRAVPYPIGKVCENLQGRVLDPDGRQVPAGTEGELCISGDNVMRGYWNLREQTDRCFLRDDASDTLWYRTGDIVLEEADGGFRYVGRKDRMVKKRGYRIELGEIESCLYGHASVREAAVVALPDEDAGVRIRAHLSVRGETRPSVILLKTYCSQRLPLYMIPDVFAFHDEIPKTSTGKTDFQTLKEMR